MESLIKKLKLEKEKEIKKLKDWGFEDGTEDSKRLTYQDFKYLEDMGEVNEETIQWLRSYRTDDVASEGFGEDEISIYIDAWQEGVLSVWNQIKDQI